MHTILIFIDFEYKKIKFRYICRKRNMRDDDRIPGVRRGG